MRRSRSLCTLLLLIAAATQSCSGYDCVEHSCAEYEGNASAAGTMVSICQRSQGDCGEGCMGWRALDTNGEKLSDCADSEPGNHALKSRTAPEIGDGGDYVREPRVTGVEYDADLGAWALWLLGVHQHLLLGSPRARWGETAWIQARA